MAVGTTNGRGLVFVPGVHGYPLPSASRVTGEHLARVGRVGARVVSIYMTDAERAEPRRWTPRLADRIGASGLHLTQLVGPQRRLLMHDTARRKEEVAVVAQGIEAAAAAGADGMLVGPGGFNDRGPWWYHPRNFERASRVSVTRSLRDLGQQAEQAGILIVVEGYQGSVLESPEVMAEIVEGAGSAAVRVNLDYVNYLTVPDVARFDEVFGNMIKTLGDRIASVHVKDATVWPRLSSHVEEVAAGRGELDLGLVVRAARKLNVPALVEHLHPRTADDAIKHLVRLAQP